METIIYIISISLQITGALLLFIKYWTRSPSDQLEEIRKKRSGVEGEVLIIGDSTLGDSEFIKELWLSRIAFICIPVGYWIGIFGDITNSNKTVVLCAVIVLTVAMVFSCYCIANSISKKEIH